MKKLSETYKELGIAFTLPIEIKNSDGNETYLEDGKGYWCKWEYDTNGNDTYYENSKGYWCKREYDINGNETYYENSKGYWCKKEYDINGNETYLEDSDNYWNKQEYDSDDNETYYEDSDGIKRGTSRSQTCDGRVVEVADIDKAMLGGSNTISKQDSSNIL